MQGTRALFLSALLIFILFPISLPAATFSIAGDLIGKPTYYHVVEKDNLYEIARRFDIGIIELLAANPNVDPWMPEEGTALAITTTHILPEVRTGIVINLSELRLFYFTEDGTVMTFPIGIGMEGWQTPTGTTSIAKKRKDPAWIPPQSIRDEDPSLPEIMPAGPDNPLGQYALNLKWQRFIIHGTNRPYGVGKRSSHGCIRLYPEDIAQLFDGVEEGTPVTVIDEPYKLGWQGDKLYLEVVPTQWQADIIAQYHRPIPLAIPEIYDAIKAKAGEAFKLNQDAVEEAVRKRHGLPVLIGIKP